MSIETFCFGNYQIGKDLEMYPLPRMGARAEGRLEKRLRLWVKRQVAEMEHGTKKQFAADIHRWPGWVSKYLKKTSYATLDDVVALATYFKLPLSAITDGELPTLPFQARQVATLWARLYEEDKDAAEAIRRRIEGLVSVPPAVDEQSNLQSPPEPKVIGRKNPGKQRGA